ncbi:MAG: F0F1 ATP synthase subunit gamma [Alphaproteobacteria bacterium]|jgi:F-type H+-transporting ATPase subunit gamma|uniref:ATP synthase gamma chain n=1 Tax=Brevundimonas mediterranea TaxID=74329 RepID=A0AB37E6Z1_9CAUL|nr:MULTISPECIES: F0F1 ATP synthase subunit gamma [Brevundimonas]MBU1272433.1 F0F1 ATP synthase subunit gamma [Alphaproteobacteria bacterium]OGN47099.1 MAG: F0F1 ATP synthase subunit gamma [Caulobacterales bacterium GWE1_67_11]OGN50529.1 MAG: F0F1 ATP synthase subunit gamma [Caulobacterales bacterium RIFCSPHIGHO2_01_FULL_67_30]EDX81447.1 ATP synthase F1, gamma subunit [Brevundimonas sp. BAL3]KDP94061.1 ATP synthase F0F1 subunit gamma [Brevundimonas sp. EAKA]
MASLKEMRNRIGSVKATQKITKAMQMVAAAKLKRAQDQAESARPYARKMASVIANLAAGVSGADAPKLLAGTGQDQRHLIVVATADKGLAGGFSTNVIRAARERIGSLIANGKDVKIIAVGRKSRDQLTRLYGDKVVHTFELSAQKTIGLPLAQPVAEMIATAFEDGQADVVTLFYSQFKSVISQVPTGKQLIPAVVEGDAAPIDLNGAVYDYEPSEEEILETLLPRNLTTQILAALYENQAGFFGSQMAAMDNATRNAGDLINALTLQYNRKRQAQITTELIEIIAGAEAL